MSRDPAPRRERRSSRQDVVERAESYVLEHLHTRVPVSHLCRVVGRSERGLRDAFYSVRGMSPVKYMRTVRLLSAQRTLRHASGHGVSVTEVATSFGFYELGRFAAAYREAF